MYKLVLFDQDNTLISGYMDNPGRDFNDWHVLPGVAARIAELRAAGVKIGVITNQGGVAFGHVSERDVETKLAQVARELGYEVPAFARELGFGPASIYAGQQDRGEWSDGVLNCYVCYADSRSPNAAYQHGAERRKPSGAMIKEALADAGVAPQDCLYVGDRPEDEAAAADAGVAFQWAAAYFESV